MPKMLKPDEVAAILGVSKGTLAYWRGQGIGPSYFKEEQTVRYPADRLSEYINSRLVRGGQEGERHA